MAVFGSTQTLARYLTHGYYSETGQSRYDWNTSTSRVISVNLTGLTADAKDMARKALAAYEAVVNLDFRETTGSAKITFDDKATHQVGRTIFSGPITGAYSSGGDLRKAEINIPKSWTDRHGTDVGDYGFQLFLHEIAHALGLGHLGKYNGGASFSQAKFTTDSWMQSVQSYFDQTENPNVAALKGHVVTPMMADIMALQSLYGRQTGGPTAGATVYGVNSDLGTYLDKVFRGTEGRMTADFMVIYDAGGTDTFNFSNDTLNQKVNLQGGTFSTVYGRVDNLGIAYGTVIERFLAGSGNDRIAGNSAANLLRGGNGQDSLSGTGGNDILYGDAGNDSLFGGTGSDRLFGGDGLDVLKGGDANDSLFGDAGADTLWGEEGADHLSGGTENDRLLGGGANDTLQGGAGNDRLEGGTGNDLLTGDSGVDAFVIHIHGGVDTVFDFVDDQDVLILDDALWGDTRDAAQVLALAQFNSSGELVFDFIGTQSLVIKGVLDKMLLVDDINII
jgi:serralysin